MVSQYCQYIAQAQCLGIIIICYCFTGNVIEVFDTYTNSRHQALFTGLLGTSKWLLIHWL